MKNVSSAVAIQIKPHISDYVGWLSPIPWQLFCTFTFAWQVSDAQARKVFEEFTARVERSVAAPLTLLRGDEKRYSGCGMPGAPRHFHVLLAASRRLHPEMIRATWTTLAGRRKNGAGADVRLYDPERNGLAYVLKFINQPQGDWDFKNLDLFLKPTQPFTLNSRQRRRLARQAGRFSAESHVQREEQRQPWPTVSTSFAVVLNSTRTDS